MIDHYLTEFDRELRVSAATRRRILVEVGDHLRDASDSRIASGIDPTEAEESAIAAFGAPADIAEPLNAQAATTAIRRLPPIVATSGMLLVAGLLWAARSHPAVAPSATMVTRASFLVAALAVQVAFVAGLRASARVLGDWRDPVAPAAHRDVVRRSSAVATVAIGVAAGGWTVALITANHRAGTTRTGEVAGATLMLIAAAALAITMATMLRRRSAEAEGPTARRSAGALGVPERVIAFVQRYPWFAAVPAALLGSAIAMVHAETSFAGAVPWGAAEAAAVFGGLWLLGPSLDLRPSRNEQLSA